MLSNHCVLHADTEREIMSTEHSNDKLSEKERGILWVPLAVISAVVLLGVVMGVGLVGVLPTGIQLSVTHCMVSIIAFAALLVIVLFSRQPDHSPGPSRRGTEALSDEERA